uniref:CSON013189 protein n=1 Tax=Culicoides sonorensis TaxID=179676 RepID=A0A336MJG6_CULSO
MDFDSPDVEKEFPGLYASEDALGKGKKDDVPETEHEKHSKKELLIGRRKEKKDKKCYAALGDDDDEEPLAGESSSSKTKKLKGFKFSKSKDKDSGKSTLEKKDKKEKDRKDKKDKDKKKDEKKLKSKEVSEEVQELGEAQPIFGVPLSVAVERSRCHDGVELPLVIRDCIDYLQDHLQNEHIHRSDGSKTRLQQLKKLYNNRESGVHDFDVPTASSLFKLFLKELPEPILTTDLLPRFEEAAALATSTEQEKELKILIDQHLPYCNRILLSWTFLHFDAIINHEKQNKFNPQNLAVVLSPVLQMSHRLFVTLLCYCTDLFSDVELTKYSPPVTSTSPNLPETRDEISKELKKQESLLNQIHAEMHAGFVTKKREEQLWEVQRIITQLKRKLRTFEKKTDSMQKSIEDTLEPPSVAADNASIELSLHKVKSCSDDENSSIRTHSNTNTESKPSPQETLVEEPPVIEKTEIIKNPDLNDVLTTDENGFMMVPVTHPDYLALIRLQLENQELLKWKDQLQSRITAERAEVVRLKKLLSEIPEAHAPSSVPINPQDEADYERLTAHYLKENALLEQKKNLLAKDLFEENRGLIQLQVELAMQQFKI